jgi:predicted nucleic acid-binding protein
VEAARLASLLGVSFFDASYLQAARIQGLRLVTADAAFYRQAMTQPDVLWLADYS